MWKIVIGIVALGIEHFITFLLFKKAIRSSSSLPPYPTSGGSLSPEVIKKITYRAIRLHDLGQKTDEIIADIDSYIND